MKPNFARGLAIALFWLPLSSQIFADEVNSVPLTGLTFNAQNNETTSSRTSNNAQTGLPTGVRWAGVAEDFAGAAMFGPAASQAGCYVFATDSTRATNAVMGVMADPHSAVIVSSGRIPYQQYVLIPSSAQMITPSGTFVSVARAVNAADVPEPASLILLGTGLSLVALGWRRRDQKKLAG